MPQVDVRCTVDNCTYWGQGNVCEATTILITSDAVGRRFPESVDAKDVDTILDTVGETPAQTCMETACKTFKAR